MSEAVKSKIYQILEGIDDEVILNQVLEDVPFYVSKSDIVDELNDEQVNELDKAIEEADNKETISWNDFKEKMDGWRKNNHHQTFSEQYIQCLLVFA